MPAKTLPQLQEQLNEIQNYLERELGNRQITFIRNSDPTTGAGVDAPVGSFLWRSSNNTRYEKIGAGANDWRLLPTQDTGTVWLNGTGAPANGTGDNGNYYIDNSTQDVYAKASGAWTKIGSLTGDGVGSSWLRGAGAPNNALGSDGNYYFDETNKSVYFKAAGAWTKDYDTGGGVATFDPNPTVTQSEYAGTIDNPVNSFFNLIASNGGLTLTSTVASGFSGYGMIIGASNGLYKGGGVTQMGAFTYTDSRQFGDGETQTVICAVLSEEYLSTGSPSVVAYWAIQTTAAAFASREFTIVLAYQNGLGTPLSFTPVTYTVPNGLNLNRYRVQFNRTTGEVTIWHDTYAIFTTTIAIPNGVNMTCGVGVQTDYGAVGGNTAERTLTLTFDGNPVDKPVGAVAMTRTVTTITPKTPNANMVDKFFRVINAPTGVTFNNHTLITDDIFTVGPAPDYVINVLSPSGTAYVKPTNVHPTLIPGNATVDAGILISNTANYSQITFNNLAPSYTNTVNVLGDEIGQYVETNDLYFEIVNPDNTADVKSLDDNGAPFEIVFSNFSHTEATFANAGGSSRYYELHVRVTGSGVDPLYFSGAMREYFGVGNYYNINTFGPSDYNGSVLNGASVLGVRFQIAAGSVTASLYANNALDDATEVTTFNSPITINTWGSRTWIRILPVVPQSVIP